MASPSFKVTIAFFQLGRLPSLRPRYPLPRHGTCQQRRSAKFEVCQNRSACRGAGRAIRILRQLVRLCAGRQNAAISLDVVEKDWRPEHQYDVMARKTSGHVLARYRQKSCEQCVMLRKTVPARTRAFPYRR